jgi:hypothetical protein
VVGRVLIVNWGMTLNSTVRVWSGKWSISSPSGSMRIVHDIVEIMRG